VARTPNRSGTAITATRIRAAPDRRAEPLLRLTRGAEVTIRGKPEDGWYRVRHGRLEGYVLSGDIATKRVALTRSKRERKRDDRSDRGRSRKREETTRGERSRKRDGKSRTVTLEQSATDHQHRRHGKRRKDQKSRNRSARQVLTAADINLRQGPSRDEAVRDVIPKRARLRLTGKHGNGFVEVHWRRQTGWAFGKHLAAAADAPARRDRDPSSWTHQELVNIIIEAADRYGQPREDMLRVANCESNFVPTAVNGPGGSYGLFQFKPGTWLSTPFAEYDIFDPRASANAAAWMWANGRRWEWVCQ
jgi:uncharacterized protein YgiM (DUF1202 family)